MPVRCSIGLAAGTPRAQSRRPGPAAENGPGASPPDLLSPLFFFLFPRPWFPVGCAPAPCTGGTAMASTPAALPLDWDALERETVDLLSEYIRIDTSNPPGNEALAAGWLADLLRREGIESTTYAHAPDRASLIARLPGSDGSGDADAVMLLNHTGVVPVQAQYWNEPPFAGLVKDGYVWGRGAQDMKGLGILELMVFLLFKRLGLPHRRDLVFFAVADEE